MGRSNKKIVRDLFVALVKRYPKQPPLFPKERQVLDHLIYAIFLENSSFQVATELFSLMENTFVDWNEVRVTTARELADLFHKLYQPIRAGERLRRTLQWVFDTVYKFDLEDYRTKGANETATFLNSNPFTTPFITTHTIATVYKMQEVPLAEGAMQVFRLLDLVEIDNENREVVNVLANALNQSEKIDFFRVIHQLGVEMLDDSKRDACFDFLRKLDTMIDERTHLPLVESPALIDPALIAREVSQAERKAKPPLLVQLEELEMVEEPIEDIILASELSVFIDEENGLEQSYELDEEIIIRSTSRGKTEVDSEVISKKTVVDIVKIVEKTTKKKTSLATDVTKSKGVVATKATPTTVPTKKESTPVKPISKAKETPKAKVVAKGVKPSVASTAKANPQKTKKTVSSSSSEKSGTKKAVSKSATAPVAKTASKVAPKTKPAVPAKPSSVKSSAAKPPAKSNSK